MNSRFELGQNVKRIAFTDCFGVFHEAVPNLIVTCIKLTVCTSMPAYYRITAEPIGQRGLYEGAERFFAPMLPAFLPTGLQLAVERGAM